MQHRQGWTVADVIVPGACDVELADPERFRAFYVHALPRVYGYFLSRCGGSAAIAEDLTQETFLAAVTQVRRGAQVLAPVPWVLGIARHTLLDHFRRQRRSGWSVVSWEDEREGDADQLTIPEHDDEARGRAVAALAAVPVTQREALILHYLDGHPVATVAALLERSLSATESLLARGRVSFRKCYEETGDDV
jgi:RNA polymerase sigma-70 factor (ECF subfamily)